jgi:hypothetical protein
MGVEAGIGPARWPSRPPRRRPSSAWGAGRADALVAMAQPVLAGGPALASDTVRRLCCGAGLTVMVDGPDGEVAAVEAKTRTIPPALRRALNARDRLHPPVLPRRPPPPTLEPGRAHHPGQHRPALPAPPPPRPRNRLPHAHPRPRPLRLPPPDGAPIAVAAGDHAIRTANTAAGVTPTPHSLHPDWDGQPPDHPSIIDGILAAQHRPRVPAGMQPGYVPRKDTRIDQACERRSVARMTNTAVHRPTRLRQPFGWRFPRCARSGLGSPPSGCRWRGSGPAQAPFGAQLVFAGPSRAVGHCSPPPNGSQQVLIRC